MVWNVKCNFGLLNNQTKTNNMGKLEVGQYWHHLLYDAEWLVKEDDIQNNFLCECTRVGSNGWRLGNIVLWYYDEFIELGYELGRHPDNIERVVRDGDVYEWVVNDEFYGMQWKQLERYQSCIKGAGDFKNGNNETDWDFTSESQWKFLYNVNDQVTPQPEQWQPKEGSQAWCNFLNCKCDIYTVYKKYVDIGIKPNDIYNHSFPVPISEIEPYTDQDKKIDFSKSGQWLSFGGSIVKTCGKQFPETFGGHYLGQHNTHYYEFRIHDNWKLLTPEQMKPILSALEKLK